MLRSVLCAAALASILATALPVTANPQAAMASDHAQAAAAPTAPPAPARSSPSAAPAPDGRDEDIIPVGPGWG
jgi:hypothetical protein